MGLGAHGVQGHTVNNDNVAIAFIFCPTLYGRTYITFLFDDYANLWYYTPTQLQLEPTGQNTVLVLHIFYPKFERTT